MTRTDSRTTWIFRRRQLFFATVTIAAAWTTLQATDAHGQWTRFRGPDGTGISDAMSIPVEFGPSDYRWQVKLPGLGHSSPVLWENKIFLTCHIDDKDERMIVCLDAADGRVLWSWKDAFEPYSAHAFNSFAASTPAVDAERVYVSWVSGETFIIVALDHEGNEVWQRRMEDFRALYGPGASPIVFEDLLIMGNEHAGDHSFLIALNSKTGKTQWQLARDSTMASYITPAVRTLADGGVELIFSGQAHGVTGVDPKSGKINWELGDLFTLKSVASPVIADGVILVSAGRGGGGQESAVVRPPSSATGGKPQLLYSDAENVPYVPTPIGLGKHFFVWSDGGVVSCLEAATGKVVWRERVGEQYFSSPVCAGGRLYGVSKEGVVVVLAAEPEYKLLARNQLPEGSYATPAVSGGRIYFRTFNHLICVGGK